MWLVLMKYTNPWALGEQALFIHGRAGIPAIWALQELSDKFSHWRQISSIFEKIAQVSIYNYFLAAEDRLLKKIIMITILRVLLPNSRQRGENQRTRSPATTQERAHCLWNSQASLQPPSPVPSTRQKRSSCGTCLLQLKAQERQLAESPSSFKRSLTEHHACQA